MNVAECIFLNFAFILCYKCVISGGVLDLGAGEKFGDGDKIDIQDNRINSTLFRTINRYKCAVEFIPEDESDQLLYGTNSWRFPKQDVKLTLTYPVSAEDTTGYILTSMQVILYSDGAHSMGYITDGGMNQDFIKMTYILPNVTQLSYQFWLYGIPKNFMYKNNTSNRNLCGSAWKP